MSNHLQSQSSPVVAPVEIKLLDTKQAAQVLGVSSRTVQNLLNSEQLRSIKIGRSRRIPVEAVEEFARSGVEVVQFPDDNLEDFLRDLRLGKARVHGRENLAEILAAHQSEIQRRDRGDTASPTYLDGLRLILAKLLVYSDKHVRRLDARKKAGVKATRDEWKATRLLTSAYDDIVSAIDGN